MKGRSKKQKGKRFEEKIAALIYDKYLKHIPEYVKFIETIDNANIKKLFLPTRDFASGASNRLESDIDLSICFKYFPFLIECKKWKSLDYKLHFLLSLENTNSIMDTTLGKVYLSIENKSVNSGLYPMVVFEYNYGTPLYFTRLTYIDLFLGNYVFTSTEEYIKNNPVFLFFNEFIISDFTKLLEFASKSILTEKK
jgi:hypothetical protein